MPNLSVEPNFSKRDPHPLKVMRYANHRAERAWKGLAASDNDAQLQLLHIKGNHFVASFSWVPAGARDGQGENCAPDSAGQHSCCWQEVQQQRAGEAASTDDGRKWQRPGIYAADGGRVVYYKNKGNIMTNILWNVWDLRDIKRALKQTPECHTTHPGTKKERENR